MTCILRLHRVLFSLLIARLHPRPRFGVCYILVFEYIRKSRSYGRMPLSQETISQRSKVDSVELVDGAFLIIMSLLSLCSSRDFLDRCMLGCS